MNECKGIFGRLFGHNYQPVFNRTPPDSLKFEVATVSAAVSMANALTRTQYVHTCCTRCGDVIEALMP